MSVWKLCPATPPPSSSQHKPKFPLCCAQGRIVLPTIQPDPDGILLELLTSTSRECIEFKTKIRKYNSILSFASVGADVDPALANGKDGVYTYRVQGQVVHLLGSLLPTRSATGDISTAGFAQLYYFDPEEQVTRRNAYYKNELSEPLLRRFQEMMDKYNPLARLYKTIRHREHGYDDIQQYTVVIKGNVEFKGRPLRQYDLPTCSEVAGLIPGDPSISPRDIILQHLTPQDGQQYKRIYETNPNYDSLSYPLIFPRGDATWTFNEYPKLQLPDGSANPQKQKQKVGDDTFGAQGDDYVGDDYADQLDAYGTGNAGEGPSMVDDAPPIPVLTTQEYYEGRFPLDTTDTESMDLGDDLPHPADDIMQPEEDPQTPSTAGYVSMREYYSYILQIRFLSDTVRLCFFWLLGRLAQQFVVDQYAKVESQRLRYLSTHQDELLSANYQGLNDALTVHDQQREQPVTSSNNLQEEVEKLARPVILPPTFTGGPRHMHQQFQDGMAMVSRYGKPDLFITFTCNPQWPEIQENLFPGQTAADRPDLTARVFYIKLKALLSDLIQEKVFGKVIAYTWVVEFQKRGLPHAHILLILKDKILTDDIDNIVSAELPDNTTCPLAYETITKCMIHGPCGVYNKDAPCMKDGPCSKGYPKPLRSHTASGEDGYPEYRRRKGTSFKNSAGINVDNSWVVPHNLWLTTKYNAHVNVEICSSIHAVKYLFKYLHKGHDRAKVQVQADGQSANDQSSSDPEVRNEIHEFRDMRYISAPESMWRLFGFPLHGHYPAVCRLQVHLPGEHNVTFNRKSNLYHVTNKNNDSQLMAFFKLNQRDQVAHKCTYL